MTTQWDRTTCQDDICTCHDPSSPPYYCTGCGCKPAGGAVEDSDIPNEWELHKVLDLIKLDYPLAVDYCIEENDEGVSILDKDDETIAVITECDLTNYWNLAELL